MVFLILNTPRFFRTTCKPTTNDSRQCNCRNIAISRGIQDHCVTVYNSYFPIARHSCPLAVATQNDGSNPKSADLAGKE